MIPTSMTELSLLLPAFFLVLCRVSGIMITAPLYGSTAIPARVKAAIALVISAAIFPMVRPELPGGVSLAAAIPGIAGELLIGLLIGVGLGMILLATQMTGMIVGQQAGLALASAFDPGTQTRSSVIGQIYFFTATTVFLAIGGHRVIITVLLDSFRSIPVLAFRMDEIPLQHLTDLMMNALLFAAKLAAPMIIALLVAKAGLGFLSRTMPQLHILSVGFALFVSIGMFLSGMEVGNLYDVLVAHLWPALESIRAILQLEAEVP